MIKTKWDKDVTDHIGTVNIKNEIELLWSIEPGVYEEN